MNVIERPNLKALVAAFKSLHKDADVPLYVLMGIPHGPTTSMQILAFSPFGQVCTNLDLEILENVGCKGDDEIANELSFLMWTSQMQAKKMKTLLFRLKILELQLINMHRFI